MKNNRGLTIKKKKNENLKTSPDTEQTDSDDTINSEQQDEPTEEPENSSVEQNADKQRKVVIRTSVGTIYFTQSDTYSFKIEGKEKHVKNTETTVKDGCLLIGFKDRKNKSMRNQKDGVTIWISAPDLKKVEFTGVGEFNCEKPLKLDEVSFEVKGVGEVNVSDLTCDELKVTLRGVGSADIHVVCDYLTARMSGVGDVTLSGTAGHADISKGGIGGVNTCNLKVGR